MNKTALRDLVLIAAFAALIIVLGAVAVPVGAAGVPIVLQNMGIALAAMLLGPRRGFLTVALFLGVGLLGVPNLAGFKPTLAALPGPTVGYLVGYLATPPIVGALTARRPRGTAAQVGAFALAGLAGVAAQYLLGSAGLVLRADMAPGAALAANVVFVPGDVAKVVVAALIAVPVLRALPELRPRRADTAAGVA